MAGFHDELVAVAPKVRVLAASALLLAPCEATGHACQPGTDGCSGLDPWQGGDKRFEGGLRDVGRVLAAQSLSESDGEHETFETVDQHVPCGRVAALAGGKEEFDVEVAIGFVLAELGFQGDASLVR